MFQPIATTSETYDEEVSTDQSVIEQIFPRNVKNNKTAIAEALQKYYSEKQHLNYMVNSCYRCHDFERVRIYEQFLKVKGIELREPEISNFFPNERFIDIRCLAEWMAIPANPEPFPGSFIPPIPSTLGKILDQLFLEHGYIPNLERLLLFYPTYLLKHCKLSKQLFENQDMDIPTVYFIGLCSATELGCVYIINRMLKKFKQAGGNISWITNQQYPKKIDVILNFARKLIRCPWEINTEMVEQALKPGDWNPREFMFLCQVVTFIQQMCTICLGMGLNEEEEEVSVLGLQNIRLEIKKFQLKSYKIQEKAQLLSKILPSLSEYQVELEHNVSKRSLKKSFRRLESQEQIEDYMKSIAKELSSQNLYKIINKNMHPLLPEYEIVDKRDQHLFSSFDHSEYNFKFNAFPILNSLTQESSNTFLDLMNYSFDMTLQNFGKETVQNGTKNFRKAMCYYSQNLCGYTHLEYDYKNNLKKNLTMAMKFQVRLLTFSPVHITKQVLQELHHVSNQVGCLDIAHTSILIANTKMTLEMMVAVKAYQGIDS